MNTSSLQNSILEILTDPTVSDIHLSSKEHIWVRRGSSLCLESEKWPQHITEIDINAFLGSLGKSAHELTENCQEHDTAIEIGHERLRLNVFRHAGNLGVIARRIPNTIPHIDQLGLPTLFKEQLLMVRGLVLVTGPMRTGKSTTAAAGLNFINHNVHGHILTIEDPISVNFGEVQNYSTRGWH